MLAEKGEIESSVYEVEAILHQLRPRLLPLWVRDGVVDLNLPSSSSISTSGGALLAGCLSLFLNLPLREGVMVLGDVSLGGRVMPIAGEGDTFKVLPLVQHYVLGGRIKIVRVAPYSLVEMQKLVSSEMQKASSGDGATTTTTTTTTTSGEWVVDGVAFRAVDSIVDLVENAFNWEGRQDMKTQVMEALLPTR